jgi:hypothetical protein
MHVRLAIALLAGLLATGCDNAPPGPEVGIDWFAGDSCWKASLDEAAACAIDSSLDGTLGADGRSCTFPDGSVVRFGDPVDLADMEGNDVDLEIVRDGVSCMSFVNRDNQGFHLTTASGTFSETGQMTLVVTCPDGTQVHASSLELLQSGEAFSALPGSSHSWTSTSFTWSLMNGRDGNVLLFSCSAAVP